MVRPRPSPRRSTSTLDPGLAFGTGIASDDAALPRWLARELRAGSVGARLRLRLGHSRDRRGEARREPRRRRRRRSAGRRGARARTPRPTASPPRSCLPDGLARRTAFDVVVANILANPLRLLAPALAARVRAGGRIVLSGMLADAGGRRGRGLCAVVYHRRLEVGRGRLGRVGRHATSDRRPAEPFSAVAVRTPASIGTRDGRRKIYPLPWLPHGLPRDAAAARDARGPGALRPLQDGVRRRRAADLARAAAQPPAQRRRGLRRGGAGAADGDAAQRAGARIRRRPEPARIEPRRRTTSPRRTIAEIAYEERFAWARPRKPRRSRQRASTAPRSRCSSSRSRAARSSITATRSRRAGPPRNPCSSRAAISSAAAIQPLRDFAMQYLSIDASDLQADPAHKGLLILTASMRSHARVAACLSRSRVDADRRERRDGRAPRPRARRLRRRDGGPRDAALPPNGEVADQALHRRQRDHAGRLPALPVLPLIEPIAGFAPKRCARRCSGLLLYN